MIEAGAFGAQCRRAMPASNVSQVFFVYAARLSRLVTAAARDRHRARAEGGHARIGVAGVEAAVRQLDARQCTVLMYGLDHQLMAGDVVVAPQAAFKIRREIAAMMDFHLFGADHAPAAFGFHTAHGGEAVRHAIAKAVAVRHLIEAIGRDYRADGMG